MKKLNRFFSLLPLLSLLIIGTMSCNTDKTKNTTTTTETAAYEVVPTGQINAYYFHATRRCATCEAVEEVTKTALNEYYGSKVSFHSINRDNETSKVMVEKFKVSGQTLLIVKDDQIINLTNDAFLNARTNPDKLKTKLKETVDSLI